MGRKNKRPGARGRVPGPVDKAVSLNFAAYDFWYDYLYSILVSSIIWEGVPDGIPEPFIEITLAEQGYALFYRDDVLNGYVCLPCTIGGQESVYRVPMWRQARAANGYHYDCDMQNSVIIYNNYRRTPSLQVVDYFAQRLANVDRTIDVNITSQKFPTLIKTSRNQQLTMTNLYEQYEGNTPVIYGDDDLDMEGITCINTGAPYIADKTETTKHHLFNDFLTWVGVENSNQDKKERMTANEVGSNYGNVEMSRNVRVNARLQACREIYSLFGLEMSCRFNSDLRTLINVGLEVLDDEQIYNTSTVDNRAVDSGV